MAEILLQHAATPTFEPPTATPGKRTARVDRGRVRPQTEIRRPIARETFYSTKCTVDQWASFEANGRNGWQRMRDLSHIGRIEETSGVRPEECCERCAEKSLECTIYTDANRERYHVANTGYGCSLCRFGGISCSFQRDRDAITQRKKKRGLADADSEIAMLRQENEALKAEVTELRDSLALYTEEFEGFDDAMPEMQP